MVEGLSKEHLPPKNIEKRLRKRLLESLGLRVTPTFGRQYFRRLFLLTETVVKRCSVKKVLFEISQNLQENTCARISFFIKLQVLGLRILSNF